MMNRSVCRSFLYWVFWGIVCGILVGCGEKGNEWGSEAEWIEVVDGRGDRVQVPKDPRRIVSLAPSVTEIVYALGEGDRLIATTPFCSYPEAARHTLKIEGFNTPDLERLLVLNPDLVLAADITQAATVRQMRQLGLHVVVLSSAGMDGLEADMTLVGEILGVPDRAREWLRGFKEVRETLQSEAGEVETRPLALLVFGPLEFYTAGPGTFVSDLIKAAGMRNVGDAMSSSWAAISREYVLEADPDVLLIVMDSDRIVAPASPELIERYRSDPYWSQLKAVQSGNLYVLERNIFNIPGPRLKEALLALAKTARSSTLPK